MSPIINQFRRMISDDGRDDKDFSKQKETLQQSQEYLRQAAEALTRAAHNLADVIKLHQRT